MEKEPVAALDRLILTGLTRMHPKQWPIGSIVARAGKEAREALQELRSDDIRDIRPDLTWVFSEERPR